MRGVVSQHTKGTFELHTETHGHAQTMRLQRILEVVRSYTVYRKRFGGMGDGIELFDFLDGRFEAVKSRRGCGAAIIKWAGPQRTTL